jgi:hypothetical protein
MSFEMPVGMAYDGSQNIDSVTFTFADHSAAEPHFAIVTRVAPVVKSGSSSYAQYRARVYRHAVDAVTSVTGKSSVDLVIRYPSFADSSDIDDDIDVLATLAASAGFKTAVEKLSLPREVASA